MDLERHPEDRARLKEFFGLLGGYIIATTGHRKGVVINMTTNEVKAAEKTKQGARIIRVSANIITKTERTQETYTLLYQLVRVKSHLSWIIRLDSTRLKGTLVKQLYPSIQVSIPGCGVTTCFDTESKEAKRPLPSFTRPVGASCWSCLNISRRPGRGWAWGQPQLSTCCAPLLPLMWDNFSCFFVS